MLGVNGWSYKPYKPFFFDVGDIYICRVAPDQNSIHFEWLAGGDGNYEILLRKRDEGTFALIGTTKDTSFDITGLTENLDYEFFVQSAGLKSRIRLARTGMVEGTVVNYLHPDDMAYSFSGRYLCSPSLLRCPDGSLLASMDLYASREPQNLTLIFRSRDNGKTWHYVTELFPCFWGKLFLHKGSVYMLSVSTEYGDLLIGRSDDNGETFCSPTVLLRGSSHSAHPGIHKNPQNIMRYNGRIWETLEWGCWANNVYHAAMVMSCDENDNLLDPASWHFTPPVPYDPNWPGTANGPSSGNIEGTLVVFPDGKLYNVMRYGIADAQPNYGLVLAYKINTDDPDAPLEYSHAISLPGNHSKFMIKQDPATGKYYTIICRITSPELRQARSLLSLMVSDDARNWKLAADLIDRRECDSHKIGFQYVDFEFEGDDIIYLCRTAANAAHNYHDSNYSTFHWIRDFRGLQPMDV